MFAISSPTSLQSFVTLHLPFPVIASFLPIRLFFSITATFFPSLPAVTAEKIPEAPPPITIISNLFKLSILSFNVFTAVVVAVDFVNAVSVPEFFEILKVLCDSVFFLHSESHYKSIDQA